MKDKGGRPQAKIDLAELEKLAGLQCTQEDVAAWFGVSVNTIKRRLREAEYREVWDAGLGKGRVSLRRKQMALADKNATMAIFLGKQYLGQRDVAALEVEHSGEVKTTYVARMPLAQDDADEWQKQHTIQ